MIIKLSFYYILSINVLSFILMYIDKKKAINHKWRIKENSLLFIAILGGSIGSILGMYYFRHKTKHIKFFIGIPVIILIQIFITYTTTVYPLMH